MNDDLPIVPILQRLVVATGLETLAPRPEDLERALAQMQAALRRVAVEVDDAIAQGLALAQAVQDDVNFPLLHRLHLGLRDILTLGLPPELVQILEGLMDGQGAIIGDELQAALGSLAADRASSQLIRGLARLLLFEGIRVNLLVAEHLSGGSVGRFDLDLGHLDALAEQELDRWLSREFETDGARPLNVMVAAALLRLEVHLELIRPYLSQLSGEIITQLQRREELELLLRRLDTADALLIRNSAPNLLGEQQLSIERLRQHHPIPLGQHSDDALYQRKHRLVERLSAGQPVDRASPALIDLLERRLKKVAP